MKNIIVKAGFAAMLAAILCSCSGGASYTDNAVLSTFPSVFVENNKQMEMLKNDMRAESNLVSGPEAARELRDKYVKLEEKLSQRKIDDATSAFEKIKDNDVPFKVDYQEDRYDITSFTVSEANSETGALTLNMKVKAKKELNSERPEYICYLILDDQNKVIWMGEINPFISIQISPRWTARSIAQGEYCCDEGSKMMLYCRSYDFTKFASVLFVSEESFRNIG